MGKRTKRVYILDDSGKCLKAGCSCCKEVLSVDKFSRASAKKYGINTMCKECTSKYKKGRTEANNGYSRKNRAKNTHNAVIYKINFIDGYVYIGQTINVTERKKSHKALSKVYDKSPMAIRLFEKDREAWKKCIDNMEIIKEFGSESDVEITEFEYELQLQALLEGEKLLGKQYKDMAFKLWTKTKLGLEEAFNIIQISKVINEGVEL